MRTNEERENLPVVILKFSGLNYYTSEFLTSGIELIEQALHELEEAEVMKLLDELQMNSLVYAARVEMDKMRRQHLQIFGARTGSIELFAVAGAAALWVMQVTVGESMKEAYKKSDIHRRLSSAFSYDVSEFGNKLKLNIDKTLRHAKRNSAFVVALSRVDIDVITQRNSKSRDNIIISLKANDNYSKIPTGFLRLRYPQS